MNGDNVADVGTGHSSSVSSFTGLPPSRKISKKSTAFS
jgi:hypothetical protein